MTEGAAGPMAEDSIEFSLREGLAHGDAMLGTIVPILRHLLTSDEHSLFSDEIIAKVRGMIADIARQLLDAIVAASGEADRREADAGALDVLAEQLGSSPALLSHVHALAMEGQLTERLQGRLAVDPVLSPLLQALIASSDPATASAAMNLLASQARFMQMQRRMQLPLTELPGDLLHGVLMTMRTIVGSDASKEESAARAETMIRTKYDESRSRAGLLSRLVIGMGGGAIAALSLSHAGAAIFLSALALASGQNRDLAVQATGEGQAARLALALRVAGLKPQAVNEQFSQLHGEITLPEGFEHLGADRAAALLAVSDAFTVD